LSRLRGRPGPKGVGESRASEGMTELAERPTLGPALRHGSRPKPWRHGRGQRVSEMEGTSGAVQAGAFRERLWKAALTAGQASRSRAGQAIRSSHTGSEWAGRDRTSVRSRFVSFFQRRRASVSDRRCQGSRRVGVNPPRHADAEVGRLEVASAVDKPLSRQDPVGDVVRDGVTRRAVARYREVGVWRDRGCARGYVQLKKSTSGTWPSCSNRKGRASQTVRGGESERMRKGLARYPRANACRKLG